MSIQMRASNKMFMRNIYHLTSKELTLLLYSSMLVLQAIDNEFIFH